MDDCVFCKIVRKELPAYVVYEDDATMCIIPLDMELLGHLLVIPKQHSQDIFSTSPETLAAIMKTVKKMSALVKEKLGATGVNIVNASGKDAEQTVFHIHFHVIPRYTNDGVKVWPKFPRPDVDKQELLKRLTG